MHSAVPNAAASAVPASLHPALLEVWACDVAEHPAATCCSASSGCVATSVVANSWASSGESRARSSTAAWAWVGSEDEESALQRPRTYVMIRRHTPSQPQAQPQAQAQSSTGTGTRIHTRNSFSVNHCMCTAEPHTHVRRYSCRDTIRRNRC